MRHCRKLLQLLANHAIVLFKLYLHDERDQIRPKPDVFHFKSCPVYAIFMLLVQCIKTRCSILVLHNYVCSLIVMPSQWVDYYTDLIKLLTGGILELHSFQSV